MKKILTAAVLASMLACGEYDAKQKPEYELSEPVTVQQNNNSSEYMIQINQPGNWIVYAGGQSQNFDWSEPVAKINTAQERTFFYPIKEERSFFALINDEQDTIIASNRELAMEEAINFRDLGGIPTREGRLTQWGKIFRSAELKELPEEDVDAMRAIALKTIIDLRTNGEIEKAPDTYPQEAGIQWMHMQMGSSLDDDQMDSLMQIMKDATPETFDGEAFMQDANRGFVDSKDKVRSIFDVLLQQQTPVVFHCTAGKDRTGFTSAMILSALGVEKDVIMQEYLLSNYYRHDHNEESVKKAAQYFGLNQDILREMMGVKPAYLEAAFEKIEKEYGSVDSYLAEGVGLTPEDINQLKGMYLQ